MQLETKVNPAMKKIALLATTVAALTFQCEAYAQSSVTLYGKLDEGLSYIHNSGGKSTQIAMTASNLTYNLWGLKGTEDLGGGYSAIFTLESFFNPTNGTLVHSDKIFGVQSWVGLATPTFGTFTAGRQFDPLTDLVQPTQGDFFLGPIFTTPGDVDNADDISLFNSAVKWASPTWAGLNMELMYSLGGVAGSTASGQVYSGALSYVYGPATVAAGYLHIDNGNARTSVRGTTTADTLFNSPVNAAYASASSINIARAGAAYVLGKFTVGGYFGYAEYVADGSSTFKTSEKFKTGSLFVNWQMAPDFQTQVGYVYTKSDGDSSAKYNQFALGADYSLSKRTDLYFQGAYQHASGQNGAGAAEAVIGSLVIASGASSQGIVTVGIRHKF